ncbi:helix-turn-helix domain-containing protein, partial [Streptomyces albidoflavus]|uniref:helix-turn-helix domain-containing protein n=2 Tax=Kitasatosporales TaxID=85011 RepID=UPI0033330D00
GQSTISKIENGVTSTNIQTVLSICEVLGITLSDVLPEEYAKLLVVAPIDPKRSQLLTKLNRMSESELDLAFNYILTFLKLDINSTTLNSINALVKAFGSLSEKERQYLITTFNSNTDN